MANPIVKSVADSASQFFSTLQQQQQLAFGQNQAAISAINSAWAPVLQTGTIPYGYSPGLDSLLQSNIINTGAAATTNATNAEALRQQQQSGGAPVLPSGADAQINAEIQATGQQKTAQGLQQEKIAGYQQGLSTLEGETSAESDISKMADPTGFAGAATGSGALALNAGNTEFQENQVDSPMNLTAGILGDIGAGAKDAAGIAAL